MHSWPGPIQCGAGDKVLRALVVGPPGGGKGTLSKRVAENFQINVLSSGDMIRSQINSGSEVS